MHLNTATALDFLEGRLEKIQEAVWTAHKDACNRCQRDFLQWKKIGTDLKRSHLTSASTKDLEVVERILSPTRQKEPAGLRSIVASIVFDSFLQPATAGVRGAGLQVGRQLLMRAAEFDIHIKVWGEGDRRQMLGQLLPRNGKSFGGGARFHLLRNCEKLDSTTTDELGEFHFKDVPEGELSLQIDLPELTVIGALNLQ